MRALHAVTFVGLSLVAASGCAGSLSMPASAASQGDEVLPVLAPATPVGSHVTEAELVDMVAGAKHLSVSDKKAVDLPKCQAL